MSGGHDKSALGVLSGDYDMAPVASDVFERMVTRGTVKGDDFRIIYKSPIFPDLVVRLCARSEAGAGQEAQATASSPSASRRDDEGIQRRRPLLPDHLQGHLGGGARRRREDPARPTTRRPTMRKPSARPRPLAKKQHAEAAAEAVAVAARMDAAAPFKPAAARRGVDRSLVIRNLRKEYRAGAPVLDDISLDHRGPRHHGDHRSVRHRQIDADPLHQPPGRSDRGRDPVPRRRSRASSRGRAAARGAAAHRHGVPGIQPGRAPVGDRERAVRAPRLCAGLARVAAQVSRTPTSTAPSSCSTPWASAISPRSAPISSPAASASASASRAR